MKPLHIHILIELVGLGIGIITLLRISLLKKQLGGRVGSALNYFMGGILWMTIAFVYTLFHQRLNTPLKGQLAFMGIDLHHLIMLVGMVFFILSTREFLKIIPKS
jgi:hypothetical protein